MRSLTLIGLVLFSMLAQATVYKWVDKVLEAKDDEELNEFFRSLGKEKGIPAENKKSAAA